MKKNISRFYLIILIMIFVILQFSIVTAETKNNNPMLKAIMINGRDIEPEFEMFTTEYVITVGESVDEVNIKAIPDDENATIEILGNTKLKLGRNKIEIKVTAEDGQAKQSYFVYITKGNSESANANLKEITIKDCELAPAFEKNTINYAFEYPGNLEKVEIQAIPEDNEAKVEIIGNENLEKVTQNIEIKVTAKDNETVKTYYLIAKKLGTLIESPEGKENEQYAEYKMETEENLQEVEKENGVKITNKENNEDSTLYILIEVLIPIIILMIIKIVHGRRKSKNEK